MVIVFMNYLFSFNGIADYQSRVIVAQQNIAATTKKHKLFMARFGNGLFEVGK
jgi:hypothetical protein